MSEKDFSTKVKTYWPIFAGVCVAVAWTVTSLLSASLSLAEVQSNVDFNKRDIEEVSTETTNQGKSISKVNERLIVLESEVKHIRTNQTENHKDIRKRLDDLMDDVKKISR